MSGCGSCGKGGGTAVIRMAVTGNEPVKYIKEPKVTESLGAPVPASADTTKKVRLRYFGGGTKKATTGVGCSTCKSGKSGYVNTTSETITFVSEDAPGGLFRQLVSIGHDIYVTEKQAEYMLQLTYKNRGGQVVHKFQKVEE